jgi:hypothetical protein
MSRSKTGDTEMKTLRGWIPAGILAVAMLFGSTGANAGTGIIIGGSGYTDPGDPCTDQSTSSKLLNAATGIIIGGASYTGIIVVDNSPTAPLCGIIIGGA